MRKAKTALDVVQIVRDNPFMAVGLGLAAGIVAGFPRGSKQGFIGAQLTALVTGIAGQALKATLSTWVLGQVRGAGSND